VTPCDGQLAVPASNCTLCGYVLEYYLALFIYLFIKTNIRYISELFLMYQLRIFFTATLSVILCCVSAAAAAQ